LIAGRGGSSLQAVRVVLMLVVAALLAWRLLATGRPHESQGVEHGSAGLASASGIQERAAGDGVEPGEVALTSIAGSFTDQDGHAHPLARFHGVPFVASAIYTRCPSVCPRTVATLQRLARSLPVGDAPRFVLFTLDPAHDTPRVLAAFAAAHALLPPRWTLLRPDSSSLPAIARALGLGFSATADGGIAHTAVIAIVDSSGHVRDRRLGLDPDPESLLAAWRSIGMTQRAPAD
jgi:protein SCO1/2